MNASILSTGNTASNTQFKQRKDSLQQYRDAGRDDLADKEAYEIAVIEEYLPAPLSDNEITRMVSEAISEAGASGMQDMGKVMALLKPFIQGRADMGAVSAMVKSQLAG